MIRRIARAGALLSAVGWMTLFVSQPAVAHPLGDVSVNIYSRIEISGESVSLRWIADVAERPAQRERAFVDSDQDGAVSDAEAEAYLDGFWVYVGPKLALTIGDVALRLQPVHRSLAFPPGQAGLPTMRVVYDFVVSMPPVADTETVGSYLETTFEGIPGWHEVIVRAGPGALLLTSSVPDKDLTDELRSYPVDRLADPLHVNGATFSFSATGTEASVAPSASPAGAASAPASTGGPGHQVDPLAALTTGDVSVVGIVTGLVVAVALGAMHALSPGHGKVLIATYLVGARADLIHGVWLGLMVAFTHTVGVLALGVVALVATEWLLPDRIVTWLGVISGVIVVLFGFGVLLGAWRRRGGSSAEHSHPHGDSSSRHHHDVSTAMRGRDVAALGFVGGLIPSGSALLLLLSAIALGRLAYGLVLIVFFGAGMAAVLTGVLASVVLARRSSLGTWERWQHPTVARWASSVPLISAVAVVGLGFFLTIGAIGAIR